MGLFAKSFAKSKGKARVRIQLFEERRKRWTERIAQALKNNGIATGSWGVAL